VKLVFIYLNNCVYYSPIVGELMNISSAMKMHIFTRGWRKFWFRNASLHSMKGKKKRDETSFRDYFVVFRSIIFFCIRLWIQLLIWRLNNRLLKCCVFFTSTCTSKFSTENYSSIIALSNNRDDCRSYRIEINIIDVPCAANSIRSQATHF
jgi:hypothetical protein